MKSIKAIRTLVPRFHVALESGIARSYVTYATNLTTINSNGAAGLGNGVLVNSRLGLQVFDINGAKIAIPGYVRSLASRTSESIQRSSLKTQKEVSKAEDPFDAPTYNVPEKTVTFTEGASYSVVILAGLGIAAAAGYAVFKGLIFEPKD